MNESQWKQLAQHFMAQHPEAYTQVTGLPVWWDKVGAEYRAAQAKWLRYVKANVQVTS